MSDLTPTNAETLRAIRSDAKHSGMKVTLLTGENFGLGCGVDVFVHPSSVSKKELSLNRDKYHRAWFMKL